MWMLKQVNNPFLIWIGMFWCCFVPQVWHLICTFWILQLKQRIQIVFGCFLWFAQIAEVGESLLSRVQVQRYAFSFQSRNTYTPQTNIFFLRVACSSSFMSGSVLLRHFFPESTVCFLFYRSWFCSLKMDFISPSFNWYFVFLFFAVSFKILGNTHNFHYGKSQNKTATVFGESFIFYTFSNRGQQKRVS